MLPLTWFLGIVGLLQQRETIIRPEISGQRPQTSGYKVPSGCCSSKYILRMSFFRRLAPLRRSLRHWVNVPLTSVFERDPLFTSIAPIVTREFVPLVPNNFPRAELKEGPKAFRLEADVPGFRKEDLSISFLNDHTIRISGTQRLNKPAAPEAETAESTHDHLKSLMK